jgi:hypothetical protein
MAGIGVAAACGSDDPAPASGRNGTMPEAGGVSTGWNLVFEESFATGFGGWNQKKSGSGELSTVDGAVSARTGDAPGTAYLTWQPPNAITYEALRVELGVLPINVGAPVACVVSVGGVRLQVSPPAIHRDDSDAGDGGGEDHPFDADVPLGRSKTVSIEIVFGKQPHGRVLFDDVEVLDTALDGELPRIDRPEIAIGLTCDETNAEMFFDDVVIYAR